MAVTASLVKELRDKTGAGMMDCKKALAETDGDMEKALDLLKKKGIAKAGKRAGRETKEGLVHSHIADGGKLGALVEINCETDFVARNEDFQGFCSDVAMHVADKAPADEATLLGQSSAKDDGQTIEAYLQQMIGKIGENIQIRRFTRFELDEQGLVHSYIHPGGKIGVLVEIGCDSDAVAAGDDFKTFAKDVAMHVAASAPLYMVPDDVPADVLEREKAIFAAQAKESGKPDNIVEKMVEGRTKKYYQEVCLMQQAYVKDPSQTIEGYMKQTVGKVGANIQIRRFTRYQLGEELPNESV